MGRDLVDKRPFVKTAVDKGHYFEVSRRNQTTGKLFIVKVERNLYIEFIRSQKKNTSILNGLGYSKAEINFLVKNILVNEKRN